jgi:hypothetical protein
MGVFVTAIFAFQQQKCVWNHSCKYVCCFFFFCARNRIPDIQTYGNIDTAAGSTTLLRLHITMGGASTRERSRLDITWVVVLFLLMLPPSASAAPVDLSSGPAAVSQFIGSIMTQCFADTAITIGTTTCGLGNITTGQGSALAVVDVSSGNATVDLSCAGQLQLSSTSRSSLLNCLQNVSQQLAAAGSGTSAQPSPVVEVSLGVTMELDVSKASTLAPTSNSDYVALALPSQLRPALSMFATTRNATNASGWSVGSTITAQRHRTSSVISGAGLWFVSPRWHLVINTTIESTAGIIVVPLLPVAVQGVPLVRLPESPLVAAQAGSMHMLLRYVSSSVSAGAMTSMVATVLPENGTVVDAGGVQSLQLWMSQIVPRLVAGSSAACSVAVQRWIGDTLNTNVTVVPRNDSTTIASVVDLAKLVNLLGGVAVMQTVVRVKMQCLLPEAVSNLLEVERLRRSTSSSSSSSISSNGLIESAVFWDMELLNDQLPLVVLVLPPPPAPNLPREDILHVYDDIERGSYHRALNDGRSAVLPATIVVSSASLPRSIVAPSRSSPAPQLEEWLDRNALAWGLFVMVLPLVVPHDQLMGIAVKAAAGGGGSGSSYNVYTSVVRAVGDDATQVLAANITLTTESSICSFVQLVSVDRSGAVAGPALAHQRSDIVCAVYTFSDTGVPLWVYQLISAILGALLMLVVMDDLISEIRDARQKARAQQRKDQRRYQTAARTEEGGAEVQEIGVISSWDDGGIGMLTVMSGAATSKLPRRQNSSTRHRAAANPIPSLGMQRQRNRNDPFHVTSQPHFIAAPMEDSAGSGRMMGTRHRPIPTSSSPLRRAYTRLCACMGALWDIAAFSANVVFLVLTLGRHPSSLLTWILVMVGVMVAALICLAVRVHVVLFSMPSRMIIRGNHQRGKHQHVDGATRREGESQDEQERGARVLEASATYAAASEVTSNRQRIQTDEAIVAGDEWETIRPSHLPLASHFWPGVAVYVLAVDATWAEIEFTQPSRSFWYGVQRLLHDVPCFVIALWFTLQYTHSTNAASVAQLFVSGAGIAFCYRGVLTALAVPVVIFASRCCARFQTTTLELWLRERTGLLTVGALASVTKAKQTHSQKQQDTTLHKRDTNVVTAPRGVPAHDDVCPSSLCGGPPVDPVVGNGVDRGDQNAVVNRDVKVSKELSSTTDDDPREKDSSKSHILAECEGCGSDEMDNDAAMDAGGDRLAAALSDEAYDNGFDDNVMETCGGSAVPLPVGVFVHEKCNVVSSEWEHKAEGASVALDDVL